MIKLIHMSTAFISISLFLLRGFWVFTGSQMIKQRWVKIIPHVNDTILLVSAIFLTFNIHQYRFTYDWLTANFIAFLFYIVFGMFALKRAKDKKNKAIFFILAIITFAYIVQTALTRNASWFL